jgi:hypothetical protein
VYSLGTAASLYSQNHNGVSGEVDIFGSYTRTSGSDYWDYATDFDGTALGSPRQANVRFDAGATAYFATGTTLELLGSATASTSVDRKSTGNYGITFASSTINAQYYQFRNMNASGLTLNASTTVTSLQNGDFSIDLNGASGMTVASSTISTNPALQIFNVKFATSTRQDLTLRKSVRRLRSGDSRIITVTMPVKHSTMTPDLLQVILVMSVGTTVTSSSPFPVRSIQMLAPLRWVRRPVTE